MSNSPFKAGHRLISKSEVLRIYPAGQTTLDKRIREGKFPSPVRLGDRAIAFWEDEVYQVLENLPRSRCPSPRLRRAVLDGVKKTSDDGEAAP